MNNIILILIIISGVLIYFYYKNDNMYKHIELVADPTIWKVGETLKIGDIKSSPSGNFKYAMSANGLEYYNINSKMNEKHNNPTNNIWYYPSIIGNQPSTNISATLTQSGFNIIGKNGSVTNSINCGNISFKYDPKTYISTPYAVSGGYDFFHLMANILEIQMIKQN